jgi:hypothetical protein
LVVVLASGVALAEQPRGTYTLDRDKWVAGTYGPAGPPIPSCGPRKLFGGQATFVIEFSDHVFVNKQQWRIDGHTRPSSNGKVEPLVVIGDPDTDSRVQIWFGVHESGAAVGILKRTGMRDGVRCGDAWQLRGTFKPP